MRNALRRGRLEAERASIAAVIPPDLSAEIRAVEKEVARIHRQRENLPPAGAATPTGPVGHAVWALGRRR